MRRKYDYSWDVGADIINPRQKGAEADESLSFRPVRSNKEILVQLEIHRKSNLKKHIIKKGKEGYEIEGFAEHTNG